MKRNISISSSAYPPPTLPVIINRIIEGLLESFHISEAVNSITRPALVCLQREARKHNERSTERV